ncbi:MAG: TonB-dependent receptor plug domain-containing protein [Prolixibacteraceae bacterium]|jgi:hypothetical protein|nr:TonB-dependent receptor plug domain-containing protein [Prolixibacteraceae bacterium]
MRFTLASILLLFCFQLNAQITVSGHIYDIQTQESLMAAHCVDSISRKSVISNAHGFYSLKLSDHNVAIVVKYLGYEPFCFTKSIKADTLIDFYLNPQIKLLNDINIVAGIPIHEQTLLGKNIVTIQAVESGPSSFGTPDLMKAITALPGISSGREGRSYIYVRGGDRGQNLILLDGAKLYNTNHAGGFISLFNTDAIKQVDVYKGGFPARYGGRASSIVDIYTRDGNRNEFSGKFSLGLLTSDILAEGPIGKKASFLFAGRTSYYDLFTLYNRWEMKRFTDASLYTFHFYDINAKLSYHFSPRNKIYLNFFDAADSYLTKNRYSGISSDEMNYRIYNTSLTLGQNLTIGSKSFLKNTASISHYKNVLSSKENWKGDETSYLSSTEITEYNLRSIIEYYPNSAHALKTGIEYSYYQFNPGSSITFDKNSDTNAVLDTTYGYTSLKHANEFTIFLEDEIQLGDKFYLNIGLREAVFNGGNKTYFRTEPRISARMMLNTNISLKANYTQMNQFNHVVIYNYTLFDKEIWLTSDDDVPPQHAQQFSTGIFATIPDYNLEFSAEAYYKRMNNLLEYKMPADGGLIFKDIKDVLVTDGTGEAYGAEFQAKYKRNGFSAELGYVLSFNYRQFEELNNGKRYPFIYDRRHEVSFLTSTKLNKSYTLNTNFVFSTGTPSTMPIGYVAENGYISGYYAYWGKNGSRMPNYHRLDMSLIKKGKTRKGREKTFRMDIFNVYARKNPVMIYYKEETGKVYGKSLFSIVPTISYSVKF